MKYLGMLMFILGISLLAVSLVMDTSVAVDYPHGNSMGFPVRVNNLGLMADKQNYMIYGAVLAILGVVTVVAYDKEKKAIVLANNSKDTINISQEIKELKILLDDGLITMDEFNNQKSKLLNS